MKLSTKTITLAGLLVAIEIVLQLIGNNAAVGGVSINLSLLPIIIGALIAGPLMGLFLGLVNGLLVVFSPLTISVFWEMTVPGTFLVCLSKSMAAGAIAGLVFKLFKERKVLGCLICSALVPIINSSLFCGYSFIFYQDWMNSGATNNGMTSVGFLFLVAIGWNFIFELVTSIILSLPIYKAVSKINLN